MGAQGKPDFAAVGAAALDMAQVLLPQWLGGHREGHEWLGERKANGGPGDSWKVNLGTGAWACFASDERGGDLVSLYAALNHLNQGAALKQVAALVGVSDRPVTVLDRIKRTELPAEPIPLNAADPIPHFKLGQPVATYRYGSAFWVLRYEKDGAKTFAQMTWRGGQWARKGAEPPMPLYGLELLAKHPDAPVMLVEGEKTCEAARSVLKAYVVMTWAGGANAVKKSDWAPLAGRDVVVWPDADDPGIKAAVQIATILQPIAKRVRVINPEDRGDGWDAADAIAEGWDAKRIAAWATARIRSVDDPNAAKKLNGQHAAPAPDPEPTPAPDPPPADDDPEPLDAPALELPAPRERVSSLSDYIDSAPVRWDALRLDTNQGGLPHATLSNASQILQMHPRLQGKIWYDTFQRKIWHTIYGAKREWDDSVSADLTVFIQQSLKLDKFGLSLVTEAVGHAARKNSKNSLTDYLSGLTWDGLERLDTWLGDTLGVERDAYSMAVAKNWPISMVARAFKPGCQVDTMPVLEGKMGRGKSSFLQILGGEWYDSIPTAIGEKDFMQEIQGLWLIEIPDMTGFGRREHSQILATVTIRNDRFRHSYGRYVENHPRGCVFAATSEGDDYLQDIRGRRRFWPLRCTSIDLDCLHGLRDAIFAEAVARYRNGEDWYSMPDEADEEQLARASADPWTEQILSQAQYLWDSSVGKTTQITAPYLLEYALGMKIQDMGQPEKNRVARIMHDHGWIKSRTNKSRCWIRPRH